MTTSLDAPSVPATSAACRPRVAGKFLWRGTEKLYLRGVTYGTFAPNADGVPFPPAAAVERDFVAMAANGINAVRTYTPPPRWLLDEAARHGLLVLCGLPWEQHVTFLDAAARRTRIVAQVQRDVRSIAGHPAVLGFAVGNEIPGDIVRWYGRRRIERFLAELARAVKTEDPEALVTYVNFPTTEYLHLPFVDFLCFNVYLEQRASLEAYLARLQNLAGDMPLVMAEVGLDSLRNGLDAQAEALAWQVETAFAAGCAGCFVFAWTDDWHRGGLEIEDWDFGLVDRERRPKPALAAVRRAYQAVPFPAQRAWPRVSVAICTHNGERTLGEALADAMALDYPDYEVIVVDDGSTDGTAEIAGRYDVRLVRTPNRGLSAARNSAWQAATGEIVAYTDDDARPDPHWLQYLVGTMDTRNLAAAGGPNIAPAGDGMVADCVANAPGGPMHVLVDDVTAEHVPGCNMAFRRSVLEEVGGFDERFRAAGDDVDICWRVQDLGYRIGFSPAAMVWHRRRNELSTYLKQQQGYGKAEALLEAKWPERYNDLGHLTWRGRIYGAGQAVTLGAPQRAVFHGRWGLAPFQSLYGGSSETFAIASAPEWHLLGISLLVLLAISPLWPTAALALPAFAIVAAVAVAQALLGAVRATFPGRAASRREALVRRCITGYLHWLQPLARLKGRLQHGLTPWRRRGVAAWAAPWPQQASVWSERWLPREAYLERLESSLLDRGAVVRHGGDFDRWDLEVRGGPFGSVRLASLLEEHGQGRQLLRVRVRPRLSALVAMPVGLILAAVWAAADGAQFTAGLLALAALPASWLAYGDLAQATGLVQDALDALRARAEARADDRRPAVSGALEGRGAR